MNIGTTRRCRTSSLGFDATGSITRKAATQFLYQQDNSLDPIKIFSNHILDLPDGIEIIVDC